MLSAAGALALAAGLVWQSAYAGFTDTTGPLSASVSTGTVALTNNVEGVAVSLVLPELRPGDSNTECIIVTSTGTEQAQVKLYGTGRTGSTTLTSAINFAWTAGTGGGANGDCTGFVPSGAVYNTTMSSFPTTYASGSLAWNTNGGAAAETRSYRLTYSLSSSASTATKGTGAAITFVWEAQQR